MVRQHVNPLSRVHQRPLPLPPLQELFEHPEQTLHLDIGSARGRFLLAMAPLQPSWNFLGIEIRRPLVEAAERDRRELSAGNLRFLFCNANVSLLCWLATLPAGQLRRVTIQFPDPWFKSRHHKRRVLQPDLLQALAATLPEGGELFLQSDVTAVIEPMVALTESSGWFSRPAEDARPWRGDNPWPVATERERLVLARGLPVYRVLYRRGSKPCSHPPPPLERSTEAAHNPSARSAGA